MMKAACVTCTEKMHIQWASEIAISESSRKRPPPVSDQLSLTSRVVAFGKFHCIQLLRTFLSDFIEALYRNRLLRN